MITAKLAELAMRSGFIDRVEDLMNWCSELFDVEFIDAWIATTGGWVSVNVSILLKVEKKITSRALVLLPLIIFVSLTKPSV